MPNSSHDHVPARNLMKIMWGALTASHLVLAAMAYFKYDATESSLGDDILQIIAIVGVASLILSYVIPHFMIKNFKPSPNDKFFNPEGILFTPFLISLVLNELGAITGFLSLVVCKSEQTSMILFGISILSILAKYPSEDKINRQIEALKRQS